MTTIDRDRVVGAGVDDLLARMPELRPFDEHNQSLLSHVHPPDWRNPTPAGRYNLVVIGAGSAGLVTAAGAAGLGAKVALIERRLMGGDCLNVGCVPSKALIRCARAVAEARRASEFGVDLGGPVRIDFGIVMERMRRLRAGIAPHDSAKRFSDMGIDVFIGDAEFVDGSTVQVGDARLRFSRAVIATGARAAAPPIPGIEAAQTLDNETFFSLTELPRRLVVIGAGPIGCEMAQTFARFGSAVTLVEAGSRVMGREDADAGAAVAAALERDGVRVLVGAKVARIERDGDVRTVHMEVAGAKSSIDADHVLVGVGRAPNVDGLGLEAAGVEYDARSGVVVDDFLRTTNRNIYAAGDICSALKFTHLSDAHARIVIQNALFFGRARVSGLVVPWCTYTDPEVAHVGMQESEAREKAIDVRTYRVELADNDRAKLDGDTDCGGFLKVHVKAGSDRVLGATLVAPHAGDMLAPITLAMTNGLGLKALGKTIAPYPTQAEIMKRAADAFSRDRLTPRVKAIFKKILEWRR